MKKFSIFFISILTLALCFSSCTDEPVGFNPVMDKPIVDVDPTPGVDPIPEVKPSAGSGKLQVDFDGETFVSTSVQSIVTDDYISIIGLRSSKGDVITLTIPSNKTGTYTWKNISVTQMGVLGLAYNVSSDKNGAFISGSDDDPDFLYPDYKDTATITIVSINTTTKKISGTFQFTGGRYNPSNNKNETKVFTKGSFTDISFAVDIPTDSNNTFSLKLDGTDYIPTSVTALSVSYGKLQQISISGARGGLESVGIVVPKNVKPGTYTVETLGSDYVVIYNKSFKAEDMFSGKSGSITVLSHDIAKKTISGTFSASLWCYLSTDIPQVSEGAFNVTYK
ncbi:DUF6252 family protein [Flavobacterium pectinovorum]|nr:DUF6252 family protein [Flavobacterium pectinovorum]